MPDIQGYVVRWDEVRDGQVVGSLFAWKNPDGVCAITDARLTATEFTTIGEAVRAKEEWRVRSARILAFTEDGTETPLPTYEEALVKLAEVEATVAALRAPGAPRGDWSILSEEDRAAVNLAVTVQVMLDEGGCAIEDLMEDYPGVTRAAAEESIAVLVKTGQARELVDDVWELIPTAAKAARWEGCLPFARRLLQVRFGAVDHLGVIWGRGETEAAAVANAEANLRKAGQARDDLRAIHL